MVKNLMRIVEKCVKKFGEFGENLEGKVVRSWRMKMSL
jgi:hypothetical protein